MLAGCTQTPEPPEPSTWRVEGFTAAAGPLDLNLEHIEQVLTRDGRLRDAYVLRAAVAPSATSQNGSTHTFYLDGDLRVLAWVMNGDQDLQTQFTVDWQLTGGLPPFGIGLWATVDLDNASFASYLGGEARTLTFPPPIQGSTVVLDLGAITPREPSGNKKWTYSSARMAPDHIGGLSVDYTGLDVLDRIDSYPYLHRKGAAQDAYPFQGADSDPLGIGANLDEILDALAEENEAFAKRYRAEQCVGRLTLSLHGATSILGGAVTERTYQGWVDFEDQGFHFDVVTTATGVDVVYRADGEGTACLDMRPTYGSLHDAATMREMFGLGSIRGIEISYAQPLLVDGLAFQRVTMDGGTIENPIRLRFDLTNGWLVDAQLVPGTDLPWST